MCHDDRLPGCCRAMMSGCVARPALNERCATLSTWARNAKRIRSWSSWSSAKVFGIWKAPGQTRHRNAPSVTSMSARRPSKRNCSARTSGSSERSSATPGSGVNEAFRGVPTGCSLHASHHFRVVCFGFFEGGCPSGADGPASPLLPFEPGSPTVSFRSAETAAR